MDRNMLKRRQNIRGPLVRPSDQPLRLSCSGSSCTYHKSQSRSPSLMPPWSTTSASGHLPTSSLIPPPRLSASPLSAALMPPPLRSIPPRRYLGHRTCFIFSHTANRSLERVSHTLSSMVFCGALRSSPGMEEVRYDWDTGFRDEVDEPMLPVRGVRSVVVWRGSSLSSTGKRSAAYPEVEEHVSYSRQRLISPAR